MANSYGANQLMEVAEREQLRAENERLRGACGRAESRCCELERELAAARADNRAFRDRFAKLRHEAACEEILDPSP